MFAIANWDNQKSWKLNKKLNMAAIFETYAGLSD